jgi:hypothetical protein
MGVALRCSGIIDKLGTNKNIDDHNILALPTLSEKEMSDKKLMWCIPHR